ncbi:NAD(P)H-hydrate dehydratase [Azohydromonas sp.]|uniref:NAD(P)H-hydrate dehydratase n=1 Tax=Azohydromonas sp. TaxID=1872666 RepID=UPI002BA90F98|nr:NAD(P)H-hydrate dehydratase [Azohydromonas sp.]HMM85110.1 NAD(P)H-hydrate dehydratase [Azohydromonas sp.]
MIAVDDHAPALPLFDAAATRHIEQRALARVPPGTLVQRAGLALAKLALALRPNARHVWVLAGPGNNGADGLDAAARLRSAGLRVSASVLADATRQGPDALAALQRARQAGVEIAEGVAAVAPRCDLAIDALLGIGLSRAPEGEMAAAIGSFNATPAPRLAVDLPSGLDADRGVAAGPAVVATHTLAMLTLKPGLFTADGRDHAGAVWWADLGERDDDAPRAWLAAARHPATLRRHAQHKGSFGDVAVIGGAPGMVGAAWLAACAASVAGAGRVHVSLLDAGAPSWHASHPELMARPALWRDGLSLLREATVVCGCGGGDAVAEALPAVLSSARRLVLDADALNAVARDTTLRTLLRHRGARVAPTVLTPHPLEAARLLGCGTRDVQADRLGHAQVLADEFGAAVVLKGSGSVTAAPGCLPWVNRSGNAALASAGTGDVLAGWLAGSLAVVAAERIDHVQRVCVQAVSRHGHAADLHARGGTAGPLRAGALLEAMQGVA